MSSPILLGRGMREMIDRLEALEGKMATLSAEVRELADQVRSLRLRNSDPVAPVPSLAHEHEDVPALAPPELFLG